MEFIFILAFIAMALAAINFILLVVRIIDSRVSVLTSLVIVGAACIVPYGLAVFASSFGRGWEGLDYALNTWIISGLIGMVALMFYLTSLKKETLNNKG